MKQKKERRVWHKKTPRLVMPDKLHNLRTFYGRLRKNVQDRLGREIESEKMHRYESEAQEIGLLSDKIRHLWKIIHGAP